MNIEFVQATEADRDYLIELRKLTIIEHLEKSGQFLSDDEHERRVDDRYECSHLIYLLNQRIGLLKYEIDTEVVHIMQLQISPQCQGQGIGGEILHRVIEKAGSRRIVLSVLKDNPALRLYLNLGFMIYSEDHYEYHLQATS
jgi:ribosomal protein S18 acetylase RimI-like enzyme